MKYRVAETDAEYAACRRLMRQVGMPENDLGFPTIMALDETGLVGFIATTPRTDMVLAGPMVLRQDKKRPFTAFRMAELYLNVMKKLGITAIIFYADEKDSGVTKFLHRFLPGLMPYAKIGSTLYYSWKIGRPLEASTMVGHA